MKTFLCVVRRVLAVLLALIFAPLGAACLIAIPLSNNYSAMVSMAIAMPTTAKSGGSNPQYFTSDYSSAAAVQEASAQLCRNDQLFAVVFQFNGVQKGGQFTVPESDVQYRSHDLYDLSDVFFWHSTHSFSGLFI